MKDLAWCEGWGAHGPRKLATTARGRCNEIDGESSYLARMRKSTDVLFKVGMIVKGVDALFEVVGGVLLTMPTRLARYITVLSDHEVFRHHEALAGRLDHMATAVVMHPSIGEATYLVVHGLAKVVLITAIFSNKKWGYQGLFIILSIFGTVEIIRAVTAHEVVTGALAAFDAAIVILIYKEYRARFVAPESAPIKAETSVDPQGV